MRDIRFRPEVADDLRDAVDWYDGKRIGFGNEFLVEYWSAIGRITDQPLAHGVTQTGPVRNIVSASRKGYFV